MGFLKGSVDFLDGGWWQNPALINATLKGYADGDGNFGKLKLTRGSKIGGIMTS